jgi:hypothetical protein
VVAGLVLAAAAAACGSGGGQARPAAPAAAVEPVPTSSDRVPSLGADLRVVTAPAGQPLVVDVRPGDASFSVAVTAAAPGGLVGIRRVTDPAGAVRYGADLAAPVVVVEDLDPRVLADAGAVGLHVGPPPGAPLAVGAWTVEVVGEAGPPAATAVVKAGDPAAPPHGIAIGRLDVVAAGEARASHRVLGVAGLAEQGHDACDAAAQATGVPPRAALVVLAEALADEVGTAAAPAAAPAAADDLAARQPDGRVDGFAAAVPGTPLVGPRSHACVAVAAAGDPAARGLVALHEVLHQAGLPQHTTERGGREHDRLPDTPECPAADRDGDGDGRVTAGECAGAGADNLLFWSTGGAHLTAEQARQVRAHPLLQPAAAP